MGVRGESSGRVAVLDEWGHRRVHGVRRRLPDAARVRGRDAVPCAGVRGGGVGRAGSERDRRGGRAGGERADALDAVVSLGRPPPPWPAAGAPQSLVATRYRESYFSMFPGIWRHGDWIRITPRGGAVIYGRSDATINREGVRMGTSEIYRAASGVAEVVDALVVDVPSVSAPALRRRRAELHMWLFVVLRPGDAARRRAETEDQAPHTRGLLAAARARRGDPDRGGAAHAVGQDARGAGEADPDGSGARGGGEHGLARQSPGARGLAELRGRCASPRAEKHEPCGRRPSRSVSKDRADETSGIDRSRARARDGPHGRAPEPLHVHPGALRRMLALAEGRGAVHRRPPRRGGLPDGRGAGAPREHVELDGGALLAGARLRGLPGAPGRGARRVPARARHGGGRIEPRHGARRHCSRSTRTSSRPRSSPTT